MGNRSRVDVKQQKQQQASSGSPVRLSSICPETAALYGYRSLPSDQKPAPQNTASSASGGSEGSKESGEIAPGSVCFGGGGREDTPLTDRGFRRGPLKTLDSDYPAPASGSVSSLCIHSWSLNPQQIPLETCPSRQAFPPSQAVWDVKFPACFPQASYRQQPRSSTGSQARDVAPREREKALFSQTSNHRSTSSVLRVHPGPIIPLPHRVSRARRRRTSWNLIRYRAQWPTSLPEAHHNTGGWYFNHPNKLEIVPSTYTGGTAGTAVSLRIKEMPRFTTCNTVTNLRDIGHGGLH
ncbi:unnamed protein product [Arctogadus glacialis]